jgi:hypothetical protein
LYAYEKRYELWRKRVVIDRTKRYLLDFIKVGRSGKQYFVYGAPEDLKGPYESAQAAQDAYNYISSHYEEFEVVNRKVQRKK